MATLPHRSRKCLDLDRSCFRGSDLAGGAVDGGEGLNLSNRQVDGVGRRNSR